MKRVADRNIIEQLQKQILSLQGHQPVSDEQSNALGLGDMERAFPGETFPKGVMHELISQSSEEATCTSGFLGVILSKLIRQGGYCMWISTIPRRSIFPPALKAFGLNPEHILFVDTTKPKETLWALEEALKCSSLTAVVGEISELAFNESRRFQLAVEQSQVTGFIHRFRPKVINATACVTRWKVNAFASDLTDEDDGVGAPAWHVQLLKVRSGQPSEWWMRYTDNELEYIHTERSASQDIIFKTG